MAKENVQIHWFRNDLRLHDNLALHNLNENEAFVGVFILDPLWLKSGRLGFPMLGPHRLRFLTQSLLDLKNNLQSKGSDLLVFYEDTESVFSILANRYNITRCSTPSTFARYEKQLIAEAEKSLPTNITQGQTTLMNPPEDVPFPVEKTPFIFGDFRKQIQKNKKDPTGALPAVESFPPLPRDYSADELLPKNWPFNEVEEMEYPSQSAIPFNGGETAGLARLEDYVSSNLVANYKNTRNRLIGADYSTKFSLWLANGSLSARTIRERIKRYEKEVKKNVSTYWVWFELMWRDFFAYQAMRYGNRFFYQSGIRGKERVYGNDMSAFRNWCEGNTGNDFVDANMIELAETGFMSNRGRQNVASYLVHDLNIDWRWGAYWFQYQLIDFDVYSNWGNWMYVAGVGNDPRTNRKFNVDFQASRYDKKRRYRELWVKS